MLSIPTNGRWTIKTASLSLGMMSPQTYTSNAPLIMIVSTYRPQCRPRPQSQHALADLMHPQPQELQEINRNRHLSTNLGLTDKRNHVDGHGFDYRFNSRLLPNRYTNSIQRAQIGYGDILAATCMQKANTVTLQKWQPAGVPQQLAHVR